MFLSDEGAVRGEKFGPFLLDLVSETIVVRAKSAKLLEPLHTLIQPLEHRYIIRYLLLSSLPLEFHGFLVGNLLLLRSLLLAYRLLFFSGIGGSCIGCCCRSSFLLLFV